MNRHIAAAVLSALAAAPAAEAHSSIHGVVRAGASPVSHVKVHIANKKHAPTATSNKSGQFAFKDLKPGAYTLFARTQHKGFARAKFVLLPNQDFDVVLALRHHRPHHLHGHTQVGPSRGFGGAVTPH